MIPKKKKNQTGEKYRSSFDREYLIIQAFRINQPSLKNLPIGSEVLGIKLKFLSDFQTESLLCDSEQVFQDHS